ncbi:metacaspase-1-like [Nymphaea colorata]|nr:metacaspase-1-like [Nymphaea colorata]
MMPVVNCPNCRKTLRLPAGAQSIRCTTCNAVSRISNPTSFPPPLPSSSLPSPGPRSSYAPPPPPTGGSSPLVYSPALPSAHGPKRAVICGISYRDSCYELEGCIKDAKYMKYLLVNRFNFPESSILMLTDEETDPSKIPTIRNLRRAMTWLVHGCQPGDSLVFHFSGHGSQIRDIDGDEVDGYDETLCPLDFETEGMLVDDELNATLVRPLPCGARLHAIIDCCHSGTALDLPFVCRMDRNGRYGWEDHNPPSGIWKGTNGGEVISISGCDDHQNSADTSALAEVISAGAMTYSFIQAIERGAGATYGSLLNAMRNAIHNADTEIDGAPLTTLLIMLLTGGNEVRSLTQEPQLSSSEAFDVYSKPFYL